MGIRTLKKAKRHVVVVFFSILFITGHLFAGQEPPVDVSWTLLVISLFGGLALFLFGMGKMSDGMKKTAGNKMRSVLSVLTRNRLTALILGAFVTMVIQSSSATTVMLVSFVQAGLMSFTQSLGIILGADIGTTVTAQLIAFKLTDYALLMISIGFGLQMTVRAENLKNISEIIFGFGVLFFGMKIMSEAMEPLRTYPGFINTMQELENPFLGLIAGTVFTALVQSSSATSGVILVLAHQGLVTLESGIPIIFGANIGTCVTAGLAVINTSREAKRVAIAHVLFKLAGVVIFIFWIPGFAGIIRDFSSKFGADTARQIANAHTMFNVSLGIMFLPFTTYFSKAIKKLLPDEKDTGTKPATKYLDESVISSPALAIELARRELSNMAAILARMLRAIIIPFVSDERWIKREGLTKEEADLLLKEIPVRDERHPQLTLLEAIDMREEKLDFLNERIEQFLMKIAGQESSKEQANEIYGMISISNDMESIGDLIHRNLVKLIGKKRELDVDFTDEGKEELMIYHQKVSGQIERLRDAFAERDLEKAKYIMGKETKYLELEEQYRVRHLERMRHKKMASINTHEVHMELMDILKQVIVYSSNIAKTFLLKCGPSQ